MHRKSRYRRLSSRCRAAVSDAWINARFYWYSARKGPLIFVSIVGVVVGALGILVYSHFANKADIHNVTCLALNIYFEARGEPEAGQYAVAEVTMNRVASRHYPNTVCGVVYQQNWDPLRKRYVAAFSWTEFETRPAPKGKEWERAWDIAENVYYGRSTSRLDGAVLYHAVYIRPSWSRDKKPIHRIGKHLFYK